MYELALWTQVAMFVTVSNSPYSSRCLPDRCHGPVSNTSHASIQMLAKQLLKQVPRVQNIAADGDAMPAYVTIPTTTFAAHQQVRQQAAQAAKLRPRLDQDPFTGSLAGGPLGHPSKQPGSPSCAAPSLLFGSRANSTSLSCPCSGCSA